MESVFCRTEEEIVHAVLAGKIASAERGIGKTQGLLIAVHLRHRGNAKIVVHNRLMAQFLAGRYSQMFPFEAKPQMLVPVRDGSNLEGISGIVYADELGLMTATVRDLLRMQGVLAGATQ